MKICISPWDVLTAAYKVDFGCGGGAVQFNSASYAGMIDFLPWYTVLAVFPTNPD